MSVDQNMLDVSAQLARISESQAAMSQRMDTFVTRAELPLLVTQSVQSTVADAVEKGMAHEEEKRQAKRTAELAARQKELDERDARRDRTIKQAAVVIGVLVSVLTFLMNSSHFLIGWLS